MFQAQAARVNEKVKMTVTKTRSVCLICLRRFGGGGEGCPPIGGEEKSSVYQSRMLVPHTGLEHAYSFSADLDNPHQGGHCIDLYTRFLQLTTRYFKIPASERLLKFKQQHKSETGEDVKVFCDQCQVLVGYVCDLYAELQTVKLHLLRKVEELESVARQSGKKVSQKLARGLFKTVSEQLNINSARQLELFRKSIILSCHRKRKGSTPQVLVPRGLFPEQWKFTYAATCMSLMRLIVIFALASPPMLKTKKEKELVGILKTKDSLKRRTSSKRNLVFEDAPHDFKHKRRGAAVTKQEVDVNNQESEDICADDNDGHFLDTADDNDSDWSTGAASPTGSLDSVGSDFNMNGDTDDGFIPRKRRRLRNSRRQRLSSGLVKIICEEDGDEEVDDYESSDNEDHDFNSKGRRSKKLPSTKKDATIPCKLCKKMFASRRGLSHHLREIHNTYLDYICDECGLKCKSSIEYLTHRREVHPGNSLRNASHKNATLPCPKCRRKFVDRRGLSKHMLRVHKSRLEYTCKVCGHKSKSAADHVAHRSSMHKKTRMGARKKTHQRTGESIFRRGKAFTYCKLCELQLPTNADYLRHCKEVHKGDRFRLECSVCKRKFADEQALERHVFMHEMDSTVLRLFNCEICSKSFFSENSLSEHFVTAHQGSYSCSVCQAKFLQTSYLRAHLDKHETEEKNFVCNFCFRSYTNEQYWQVHQKVAHGGSERFFCDADHCVEEFNNVQELNEHTKTHVEELRNKDSGDKDQETKSSKSDLQAETESTTQGKSNVIEENGDSTQDNTKENKTEENDKGQIFTCSTCGWVFLKMYNLTLHELVHVPFSNQINGDRTKKGYECPVEGCEMTCRLKNNLISHFNFVHGTRHKPYECSECGHKFTHFLWFKTHLRIHEDRKSERKLICGICDAEFEDSVSLCAHKKQTHDLTVRTNENVDVILADMANGLPIPNKKRRGRPPLLRSEDQMQKEREEAERMMNVPCECCGLRFLSGYKLRKHLERKHELVPDDKKTVQCNFCNLKFAQKQTHQLHGISIHLHKYRFVCDAEKCYEEFQNHMDLNKHLEKVHLLGTTNEGDQENVMEVATENGSVTESNPVSNKEGKTETSETVTTTTTDEKIPTSPPVKVLSLSYCKTCNWGFVDPSFLELHELCHIAPVGRAYSCPMCPRTFSSTSKLTYHYNSEHGIKLKQFKCFECPTTFYTKIGLRLHMHRHERRNNVSQDERFICIDCGRTFADLCLLNYHRKDHNPENHVTCPEEGCGKVFVNKSRLNTHLRKMHGQGDRFPCPYCGASFVYENETKKHIEWVHGPAKYECDICHKKLRRPGALRKHKLLHNTDPNSIESYVCAECGNQYKSEEGLKFHLASIHTPDHLKKFACPHCPYKVHRRMLFRMHLKTCLKNKGLPYDEAKWGKLPAVKKYTGPPRKPGRKPGWNKKKEIEEDEMEEKSTTEDEESSEEEEKPEIQQQQHQQTVPVSSSTTNVINAIIANLTGLPELNTMTEQSNENTTMTARRRTRGNARRQSKDTTTTTNVSTLTSAHPSTIDHTLFQSIAQPPLLPHQIPSHPQLFGNTHVPNYQNWLNTTSASSTAFPFQQQQHQFSDNEQKQNFSHTPSPPTTQLHHQQQHNAVYSPSHVYSPPLQDQPQNLHHTRK